MMQIKEIEAIKLLLATPKKITIIPHRNPDGDAMGSTLGQIYRDWETDRKSTRLNSSH